MFSKRNANLFFFLLFSCLVACTNTSAPSLVFSDREISFWDSIITQSLFESYAPPGLFEPAKTEKALSYQFVLSPVNEVEGSVFGVVVTVTKFSDVKKVSGVSAFGPAGAETSYTFITNDQKFHIETRFFQTGLVKKEDGSSGENGLLDIGSKITSRYELIGKR